MFGIKAATTVRQIQSTLVAGGSNLLGAACNTTSALQVPQAQSPKESATLLNYKDAVIGIAVSKLHVPSARRINFFIPTADAMESVEVKLASGAQEITPSGGGQVDTAAQNSLMSTSFQGDHRTRHTRKRSE